MLWLLSLSAFSDNSLRLSPVTAHDHAGYIWIVTILSLIYSSLATIIRIGVNFRIYGVDDFLLFFAMVRLDLPRVRS